MLPLHQASVAEARADDPDRTGLSGVALRVLFPTELRPRWPPARLESNQRPLPLAQRSVP